MGDGSGDFRVGDRDDYAEAGAMTAAGWYLRLVLGLEHRSNRARAGGVRYHRALGEAIALRAARADTKSA